MACATDLKGAPCRHGADEGLSIAMTCMMALTGGDVISLRLPQFTCPNSTGNLILEGRSKDVFDSYSQWDEGAKSLRLAVGGAGVVVHEQLSVSVRVSCVPHERLCCQPPARAQRAPPRRV